MDINDGYKLWTELRRYKDEATVGIGKMWLLMQLNPKRNLFKIDVSMHLQSSMRYFLENYASYQKILFGYFI